MSIGQKLADFIATPKYIIAGAFGLVGVISIVSTFAWSNSGISKPYLLFNPNRSGATFAYAPSSVFEYPYDSHFYCGNRGNGEIKDYIYLRRYKNVGGTWNYERDQAVLSPSSGKWDSKHVCDPAVVKGKFYMNGVTYQWAMFYTGTQDPNNNGTYNSIGVAFSNNQVNWVKYPNPLISRTKNTWGVGQPSVTSVNGQGRVMLFYTRDDLSSNATADTYARYLDLSNMGSIKTLKGEWKITTSGITPNQNGRSVLYNADFVYDSSRDRFYVSHPLRNDSKSPSWIAVAEEIAWIPGGNLWNGDGYWRVHKQIDASITGKAKNHNSGLHRNAYGNLPNPNQIRLNITASDSKPWPDALWTYRIYSMTFAP